MRNVIAAAALLVTSPALAGTAPDAAPVASACAGPEFKQLDFWLGEWDVRWLDSPGTPAGQGTNHITRTHDGCVTEEHFDGGDLKGHSISIYHAPAKAWRQNWVDNQGGYFDLKGGPEENGDFVLTTLPRASSPAANRMIFTDIKPDTFTWRWQRTMDGKTWDDSWVIY